KEFQLDMLTTAREPDELIVAVRFPVTGRPGVAFREVGRRHGDFAIVAIAAEVDGKTARLGVGGLVGKPVVRPVPDGGAKDAVGPMVRGLDVLEDLHGSAAM